MPDPATNTTLIRALLTVAKGRGGRAWLLGNLERATLNLAENRPRTKVLNVDGVSTEFVHDMGTDQAVALFEQALTEWDAQDENAPFDAASGGVLNFSFGRIPH